MSVRRLVCSLFVMVVGVLGLASAPALAAPLEAPDLIVESVTATSATLHGVLNPSKTSEAGTYEFLYKQGKAGCAGGTKVPVPAGLMTGVREEPYEGISNLAQDTEYTACLRVVNTTSSPTEEATSTAVTFTTAIPPETPTVVSPLKSITAATATLEGVLNPHAAGDPGSYEFLYSPSATGCEGGEVSGGNAFGDKEEAVKAEVTLLPNTTYTFCLRAHNEAGEESALSTPARFTTLAVPAAVEGESYSGVDATEARLEAMVNSGHAETAYHFEYGLSVGSYDVSLPAAEIRAGLTGVEVSTVATGLTPSTTYHYRVVVSNSQSPAGGTPGPDETFTTPAAQGKGSPSACSNEQRRAEQPYALELPDCRAYEMVSPVETSGQDATDSFVASGPRAAVSGEAVTFASRGDFADPTGDAYENQFLSRRGREGWSTQEITPLHDPTEGELQTSYESTAFTPELTAGIASTNASLTVEVPQVGHGEYGLYVDDFAGNSYRYVANAGETEAAMIGTSTDLSHVVFAPGEGKISEWVDGQVVPVNVANNGVSMEASIGSLHYYQSYGGDHSTWHAVSANGSRVYFTSPAYTFSGSSGFNPIPGELYLRENAEQPQSPISGEECTVPSDACTVEASASQRRVADPHGPQVAHFWGASANGSKVFFTSTAELTEDAKTGPADNAANLYEYDLERPEGERLKDLTVDETDTDGAAVQGVVQISEEGSYVYFVATGAFAGKAVAGSPNLYVSHEGGAPRFIATLAAGETGDSSVWHGEGEGDDTEFSAGPEVNNAVVTSDGTRLAFMSERSLTGYDNEQAEPGECEGKIGGTGDGSESGRCQEIYLYDAETAGLACVSCNPSGARPVGPSNITIFNHYGLAEYRPRNLLEDGTLFFDSTDALVPHASDGRENVYEYKDGRVYPISDVAGGYESFFMDASANGENVFFATADQLLPQDTSNNVVVYDARVGGGYPVTVSPPSCNNGDSCKPPPAPQPGVFGAPGSATFSGPGNIAPVVAVMPAVKAKAKVVKCKKGYEKKKGKCVKTRKSKKKAKKSTHRKGSK
jgi:hypothetical protein